MRKLLRAVAHHNMKIAGITQINRNQSLNSRGEKQGSKFARSWKSYI
jgi:hypothetical protein